MNEELEKGFEQFEELLRECRDLNKSSGVAERILRIGPLASKLSYSDARTYRPPFVALVQRLIADQRAKQELRKEPRAEGGAE